MGKNQDPGSGINIPDPQHCFLHCFSVKASPGEVLPHLQCSVLPAVGRRQFSCSTTSSSALDRYSQLLRAVPAPEHGTSRGHAHWLQGGGTDPLPASPLLDQVQYTGDTLIGYREEALIHYLPPLSWTRYSTQGTRSLATGRRLWFTTCLPSVQYTGDTLIGYREEALVRYLPPLSWTRYSTQGTRSLATGRRLWSTTCLPSPGPGTVHRGHAHWLQGGGPGSPLCPSPCFIYAFPSSVFILGELGGRRREQRPLWLKL
jgi:hypothetical protein